MVVGFLRAAARFVGCSSWPEKKMKGQESFFFFFLFYEARERLARGFF